MQINSFQSSGFGNRITEPQTQTNGRATIGHATRCVFALAVLLLFSTALFAGDFNFINGDVPFGTTTTFADTNNGMTATFSSPADPGGFITAQNFFSFPGFQILVDPGPAGASNIPLNISFSAPLRDISMNFGIDGQSGPFQLEAFLGGKLVGSTTVNGSVPPGGNFGEGTISFAGDFDSVELISSSTPYFGIANIGADPVPEPTSLMLLVPALAGVGGVLRRKLKK